MPLILPLPLTFFTSKSWENCLLKILVNISVLKFTPSKQWDICLNQKHTFMYITKRNVDQDVAIEWIKGTKFYVKITLKSVYWRILEQFECLRVPFKYRNSLNFCYVFLKVLQISKDQMLLQCHRLLHPLELVHLRYSWWQRTLAPKKYINTCT